MLCVKGKRKIPHTFIECLAWLTRIKSREFSPKLQLAHIPLLGAFFLCLFFRKLIKVEAI